MLTGSNEGVFHGRLANFTLKFTSKCLPFCFGPRRRMINSTTGSNTSNAVSVRRKAYHSPYERAVYLMERLLRHPSMSTFLYPILIDEKHQNTGVYKEPTEPLLTLFNRGYTLNILLNEMESPFVATIDLTVDNQMELFWRGCIDAGIVNEIEYAEDDRQELTLNTVRHMLDVLEERGKLGQMDPRYSTPRSVYPKVIESSSRVAELARTETVYIHDLERLLDLLSRDDPFYRNIQELVVLHRQFSMRIEYIAAQHPLDQLLDAAFEGLQSGFMAYSRFCAERIRHEKKNVRESTESDALMMRPVQRLAQYPLLFQSIVTSLCDSCVTLPAVHQPIKAIESADRAMRRSKYILRQANEAAREAMNEIKRDDFFARVDCPPTGLGKLLTSGTVSVRILREFTDLQMYLFDKRLVLCCPVVRRQPIRVSRVRRTLSALHLAIGSPPKRPKRQSASSSSTATLHDEAEYRLPEIGTVSTPSGVLLSSHVSLATLRDPPRIAFVSSADVTIQEEDEEEDTEPLSLVVRRSFPTEAISQVSQSVETGGTMRLTVQFMAHEGNTSSLMVVRKLSPEDASLWLRMLQQATTLVSIDDDPSRRLLVNPGFSKAVLGRNI